MNVSFHGNYLLKVNPSKQDTITDVLAKKEREYPYKTNKPFYADEVRRGLVHIITNEDLKEMNDAVQRIWEYSSNIVPKGDIRTKIAEAYRQRADKVDLTDIWK